MRTPPLLMAALLAAAPLPVAAQRSIPIMEFNLGLAGYKAGYDPTSRESQGAYGGAVGGKFSLLGLLTRSMSDGQWFIGDQIGAELGGIYWERKDCVECGEGAIRMHFEMAAAGGLRLNNGMTVIARLGVMGEDDTGPGDVGWGSTFVSGRADTDRFSLELGGGPGGGDNTGMLYGNGRMYFGTGKYIGGRVQQAKRMLEDSDIEMTERSFMIYIGVDR